MEAHSVFGIIVSSKNDGSHLVAVRRNLSLSLLEIFFSVFFALPEQVFFHKIHTFCFELLVIIDNLCTNNKKRQAHLKMELPVRAVIKEVARGNASPKSGPKSLSRSQNQSAKGCLAPPLLITLTGSTPRGVNCLQLCTLRNFHLQMMST